MLAQPGFLNENLALFSILEVFFCIKFFAFWQIILQKTVNNKIVCNDFGASFKFFLLQTYWYHYKFQLIYRIFRKTIILSHRPEFKSHKKLILHQLYIWDL